MAVPAIRQTSADGVFIKGKGYDLGIGRFRYEVFAYSPNKQTRVDYPFEISAQVMSINQEVPITNLQNNTFKFIDNDKPRRVHFRFSGLRGGTTYMVVAVIRDGKTGRVIDTETDAVRTRGDPILSYGSAGYRGDIIINERNECVGKGLQVETLHTDAPAHTNEPMAITVPQNINVFLPGDDVTRTNQSEEESNKTYPMPAEPPVSFYSGVPNQALDLTTPEVITTSQHDTRPMWQSKTNLGVKPIFANVQGFDSLFALWKR